MLITESLDRQDPYTVRVAVAQALQYLTPHFQKDNVVPLFDFMVTHEALGDRNSDVRRALLDACIAVIDVHGASAVSELIKLFEDYLASPASSETSDYVKEAAIIVRPDSTALIPAFRPPRSSLGQLRQPYSGCY
jgi:hypothetical protein